jgi:hypothetical protein
VLVRQRWLVLAAIAALGAAGLAGAGDDAAPGSDAFAGVVKAWPARDAAAVVALMPGEGRLQLSLEGAGGAKISGRFPKENAQAILKRYFEQIESARLKDATPADAKTFTRQYDYAYRPRGADERTTRLSFTLQRAGEGYALIAAEERPKKQ